MEPVQENQTTSPLNPPVLSGAGLRHHGNAGARMSGDSRKHGVLTFLVSPARRPFSSTEQACTGVAVFVDWYNHQRRHSGIRFVTPSHDCMTSGRGWLSRQTPGKPAHLTNE